jgi:cytochrome c
MSATVGRPIVQVRRLGVALAFGALSSTAHAQDAAAGKQVFAQCAACHSTSDSNGIGPGLKGVVGRKAGSVAGFRYSSALAQTGYAWDEKALDAFLASPSKAIPGNAMPFPGLSDAKQRADVIAFLETLK